MQGCKLTGGQKGRCSACSGGKTLPPRGRRRQKITQGCDEAPKSPETQIMTRFKQIYYFVFFIFPPTAMNLGIYHADGGCVMIYG